MSKIRVDFIRGRRVESNHQIKALITNIKGKVLLSTNNDNDFFFTRSSIKIFQAIPFAMSDAIQRFKLSRKHIALACASHKGEKFHLNELKKWIFKTKLETKNLQCGVHGPLDKKSLENIFANIDNYLDDNGYVIYTFMDGQKVLDLFKKHKIKNKKSYQWYSSQDPKTKIYEITRNFSGDKLKPLGQPIEVFVQSIGAVHEEYLVNYENLVKFFTKNNYKIFESKPFDEYF